MVRSLEEIKGDLKNILNYLEPQKETYSKCYDTVKDCLDENASARDILEKLSTLEADEYPPVLRESFYEIYEQLNQITSVRGDASIGKDSIKDNEVVKNEEFVQKKESKPKVRKREFKNNRLGNSGFNNRGIYIVLLFSVIVSILLIICLLLFK